MGSRWKVRMYRPQRDIQNENPSSLVFVIIDREESGPRNAEGVFLTHRRISVRKTDTHLKVTRKKSEIHDFNRGICAVYLGCHSYRCGYGEIIRHGDLFVDPCPVFERLLIDKEQCHLQIRPYRILPGNVSLCPTGSIGGVVPSLKNLTLKAEYHTLPTRKVVTVFVEVFVSNRAKLLPFPSVAKIAG